VAKELPAGERAVAPFAFLDERRVLRKLSAVISSRAKIVAVTKGSGRRRIVADYIGGGVIVTSSITNEAVDDLALEVGDDALRHSRRRM